MESKPENQFNNQNKEKNSRGRIISIKRFFSGVHACVNGADALTNFTSTSFGRLFIL
jgi:hypothetical protein